MTIAEKSQYKIVGHDTKRTDAPNKLTGQERFTADLDFPGLLHARPITAYYARARVIAIHKEAALAVPGVVAVITAADLPIKPLGQGVVSRKRVPLAVDEVLYYGQPVAIVLGETAAAAQDGADAVQIEYEALPGVTSIEAGLAEDAPHVRPRAASGADAEAGAHSTDAAQKVAHATELPANVSNSVQLTRGDVEQGFAEADAIVEKTYHTPMLHQSYLETQICTAVPDRMGNIEIYTSTQAMFGVRNEVAGALGLPLARVKVVAMPVGGGFGGKFILIEPLVAALAWKVKRPVILAFDRETDLLAANPSPEATIELKMGGKKDGSITALQAHVVFDTGAYPGSPMQGAATALGSNYRVANLAITGYEVVTNRPGAGAYRGPGAPQATFALETHMDALATELGLDPIDFRLQNAVKEGDLRANGLTWPRIGMIEVLEALKSHPAWQNRSKPTADGPIKRGTGIAVGGWGGGLEPASSTCRLDHDGTFTLMTGIADLTGSTTSMQLIAAEILGLPAEKINVIVGDSNSAPYTGASGGSKTTFTVGAAVIAAAEDAVRQLKAIASQELEAAEDDLEVADGKVSIKGLPSRYIEITDIARKSMNFGGRYNPVHGMGQSAITAGAPAFAAHLAEVEVDTETGDVVVTKFVAIQDVGFAINPAEVRGQIHGGVTQGIGMALYEQMVYGENGELLTGSLMDYAIQTAPQVPRDFDVQLVFVPAEHGPFGVKGVGEPPIIPAAAAVGNAIANATGVHVAYLPATPERVLSALQAGAAG